MSERSEVEAHVVSTRFSVEVAGNSVPALFFAPREPGDGPLPLVLIQHPATSSKDDYFVADVARLWTARGWVCGGIDAPLHGDREPHDPMSLFVDRDRLEDAVAQFTFEVAAVLEDLEGRYVIDPERIAFVGYSLGSMMGLPAVAASGRFQVAVFCLVGEGGVVGAASSPDGPVRSLTDVSVRIVGKTDDQLIPRESTQALFDALPGEKDLVWLPGGHFEIGPEVTAAAFEWLDATL